MEFVFHRSYRGKIKGVIFDWAGTTVDYGCLAPAAAFTELFKRHGVEATIAQAREPMGLHKRDHIAAMLQMPPLAEQWQAKHGSAPVDGDVQALFEEFIPLPLDVLDKYLNVIPGTTDTAKYLHKRAIKVGATTGYNEEMMQKCLDAGKKAGYEPDASVCAVQVPAGRPAPWMAVKAAMEMAVYPFEAIVKVGDTVTDIDEGLNGGMWTVGVTLTGNEMGLSEADVQAMDEEALHERQRHGREKLRRAGAHYVVESVYDVPTVIEDINERLRHGEKP